MAQWGIVCSRHGRSVEGDRVGDVSGAERPRRSGGHRAAVMEMSRYSRGQARCRAGVDTTLARVWWWSDSAHCVQGGRVTIRVRPQLVNPSKTGPRQMRVYTGDVWVNAWWYSSAACEI